MRFAPSDPALPPASELLAAMIDEMHGLYGSIDGPGGSTLSLEELEPPNGTYLVGWEDDVVVAGGAFRRLGPDVVEIKRMYVVPDHRGRGVAAALLDALERSARAMGYRTARLDTGRHQPHAQRLYERSGYRSVPTTTTTSTPASGARRT